MPIHGRAASEGVPSIPMTGPAESTFTIAGRLYVLQTWTAAQWDRLPPDERPAKCWRHGAGWAAVEPS